MTQEDLAKKCGVTRQTIIALERGTYSPSLDLAFKLAHTFGMAIEDVFQWQSNGRKKQRTGMRDVEG